MGGLVVGWMSACLPKGMAEGGEDSVGETGASGTTSAADTGGSSTGMTTVPEPTTGLAGECTPGDTKPGELDCGEDCVCSSEGKWECPVVFACSETGVTPPDETTTTATATSEGTSSGSTSGETGETGETTGGDVTIDLPACDKLAPSDMFTLGKVVVVGDVLNIEVSFGGGCEKHDFVLCLLGTKEDVVLLGIDHDAHMDACDAIINESRELDLTPLQVLGSPVQMSLTDWPQQLEYTF